VRARGVRQPLGLASASHPPPIMIVCAAIAQTDHRARLAPALPVDLGGVIACPFTCSRRHR
jgi:hypothetical protein